MARPWRRSTKIALSIWVVVVLLQVAAFTGTFLLYTNRYVITDNAQVDGTAIDINAPISGTLSQWDIDVGSEVGAGQLVGRIRLQDTVLKPGQSVRSPGRGTVAVNEVVKGQWVTAGSQLAVAYDLGQIYVTARVSENRIRDVRLGAPVDISVASFPDSHVLGVVEEIQSSSAQSLDVYPSPDQNTQNPQKITQYVPVRIRMTDTDGAAVTPGMNVTVHIHRFS